MSSSSNDETENQTDNMRNKSVMPIVPPSSGVRQTSRPLLEPNPSQPRSGIPVAPESRPRVLPSSRNPSENSGVTKIAFGILSFAVVALGGGSG